ncbi:MAG TPA: hypothetical protein VK471_00325 [Solirubrobacterales bacterium]|nr:hypothetical protein [Solirubrobacterales bacterium]
MKCLTPILATLALALALVPSAQASFGFSEFDSGFSEKDGSPTIQAGSHPYALEVNFRLNQKAEPGFNPDGEAKDLNVHFPPGFVGNPAAMPTCRTANFLTLDPITETPQCPDSTAVGTVIPEIVNPGAAATRAVFNLTPPPGAAAKFGFVVLSVPVTVEVGLSHKPPYQVLSKLTNIPQPVKFFGSEFTLWGNPPDPAHDPERGSCIRHPGTSCPVSLPQVPFLTLPTRCEGPLLTSYEMDSWQNPGAFLTDGEPDLSDPAWVTGSSESHYPTKPPVPLPIAGCGRLAFKPTMSAKPTTKAGESGTGLDFSLAVNDEGLTNPTGLANSDLKKAEVTLPEGVTINPSVGEGLSVCTPAQLAKETAFSAPGEGCPNASKLGTVHVVTPIVDEAIDGQVYLAQQDDPSTTQRGAENPFDSLIALYIVLQNPKLGVSVVLPARVEPDPKTGQLITIVEDAPQTPFSEFAFHFREGARSPLITPAICGSYETKAVLTPWSGGAPVTTTSSFQITSGVNGGPCPAGGIPPFHPDFQAGAVNNNAGSFSPFNMRLIRSDGEQDMTKFSSILPPGELGSLAGVGKCPDSAVAVAKAKTGRQELTSPSCPAGSLIGHTLAGAGVGGALTYVGGKIYLAGSYHGDPLSVISITPAVAGPFDAGTVVVRLALTLNPKTAEVEVDGAASDPIPHILKGIVLKVRDLRVYVDRPNFTLNPTSCAESSAKATLFGSYLDVFDPADDVPVALSTRYQAANCLNLGFKPKLDLRLKGGTKRGGHPGLTATYTPRKGDANVKGLIVRLPRSAFLDQAHIRTICTRVQFDAKTCPNGARYGFIRAFTPLLDTPLEGPVYLRSSNHKLPDLVFDLHGLVDVEVATRIDSSHGGIRATVESAPDAPLSKVVLQMQGAKKGLIINSRNLCGATSKANVEFSGHNGKQFSTKPVMRADCGGKRKRAGKH